jgi:hypothetical protein
VLPSFLIALYISAFPEVFLPEYVSRNGKGFSKDFSTYQQMDVLSSTIVRLNLSVCPSIPN